IRPAPPKHDFQLLNANHLHRNACATRQGARILGIAMSSADTTSDTERYSHERYRMVESQLRRRGIHDERVLEAMLRIPRHEFVPEGYKSQAYEDHPIPIG